MNKSIKDMKRITAIFTALAGLALLFSTSCTKPDLHVVEYLEVNASNLHGNWKLQSVNGELEKEPAFFYINFDRSGNKYQIWENHSAIPSTYNHSEGTFAFYTEPEVGTYIRGVDSIKEEWSDTYVIKDLTKNTMTWVGMKDPSFVQVFQRIDKVPVAE
jgi:hypothetical protein